MTSLMKRCKSAGVIKIVGWCYGSYGSIIGLGLVLIITCQQIVFNPTISIKRGYYFTYPAFSYRVGDIVLFCVADKDQVAVMHKLGLPYAGGECSYHSPYLMKYIVAGAGDWLEVAADGIRVNNHLYPDSSAISLQNGINLQHLLPGKVKLGVNQYVMLGLTPHSYDSRYFGVVSGGQIYRKAYLILPADHLLW